MNYQTPKAISSHKPPSPSQPHIPKLKIRRETIALPPAVAERLGREAKLPTLSAGPGSRRS
jgi:hypothetical protein